MLDKGQTMAEALSYAPLPKDVVAKEKAAFTHRLSRKKRLAVGT